MIKPNWDIFKVKFSENPQDAFEWFCYLLFCREFGRKHGIFRYINQAGIETDPIEVDGVQVAWQAKFYDSALSSHKPEILDCLDKTSKYYPDVKQLHFYSNQSWGQNKGEKPEGQKEVEEKADALGIEIRWCPTSFFESEFVTDENEDISNHFFSNNQSAVELSKELSERSALVLRAIRTEIPFRDTHIKISRDFEIAKLQKAPSQAIVIAGSAGTGKTAIIKDWYESSSSGSSFFVFKAQEFAVSHINDLFGGSTIDQLLMLYKEQDQKIVVIDSAERLLDISNPEPSKLLIKKLIDDGWKVIFTTRESYTNDLIQDLTDIYGICTETIKIGALREEQLADLAVNANFVLPGDEKLKTLIQTPLYLSFYLKYYTEPQLFDYTSFRKEIWNKEIVSGNPRRGISFVELVKKRVQAGTFFVKPDTEHEIIDQLRIDGILGYESSGYFITHDLYEEWAIEEIIKAEFQNQINECQFLEAITDRLPIRRTFRNWVSEQLMLQNNEAILFVHEIMTNTEIAQHWRDDAIIAVLLSDYSSTFFTDYSEHLLDSDCELLKRIIFLLRIACKTVDYESLTSSGKTVNLELLDAYMTIPKGQGWAETITFVYNHLDRIGIKHISFVFPVLMEWNTKNRNGETTKYATQIALKYYLYQVENDPYFHGSPVLFKIIAMGAIEATEGLTEIFDTVIQNGKVDRRKPHSELVEFVLSEIDAIPICYALPQKVIELARIYWGEKPDPNDYHGIDADHYYGLISHRIDDYPPSAYKTPVLWLLRAKPLETIEFICEFVNECITFYATSKFEDVIEIGLKVYSSVHSQYSSQALWSMYRGTGNLITPYLLQSIHMALEKFLLESEIETAYLKVILKTILLKSKSVSLTAIVSSVVMAKSNELFDIATILFKTRQLYVLDQVRSLGERNVEMLIYPLGHNIRNELFDSERLETSKLKHRKIDLIGLFLHYQIFRTGSTTEDEVHERQKILWEILDNYYAELPPESEQTQNDLTWQITLGKMDRRKMAIETKESDQGIELHFNPDLPQHVTEFSEKSVVEATSKLSYIPLHNWANSKLRQEHADSNSSYELNPITALNEAKAILEIMRSGNDASFDLFNRSIPVLVSTLMIRDYQILLSLDDFAFCAEVMIKFSSLVFDDNYHNQVGSGMDFTILYLPEILTQNEGQKYLHHIKLILLRSLTKHDALGVFGSSRFYDLAVSAIQRMNTPFPDESKSLLIGFIIISDLFEKQCRNNWQNREYGFEAFYHEEIELFERVLGNDVDISDLGSISEISPQILSVAFKLLMNHELDNELISLRIQIVEQLATRLMNHERKNKIDHAVKHEFLNTYSTILLLSPDTTTVDSLLEPFISYFCVHEVYGELFKEFVASEDKLNKYDNFWYVWHKFKPLIIAQCNSSNRMAQEIVKSYLFATIHRNDNTESWHSIKDSNRMFFSDISSKVSSNPATLYAISKLINDIGRPLMVYGISWLSKMVKENPELATIKLEEYTVYYLEKAVRRYIYNERENIRRARVKKEEILILLDLLIQKESVIAFMLRESII